MSQEEENWCGGKDSNLHGIATASPSSWCVCQFRHHRIKLNRCFYVLLGSGSPLEVAVAFLRLRLSCNLAQKQSKLYHSFRASRNFCSAAIMASESAKRAACSPELSQEPSLESAQEFAAAPVS